MSFLTSSLRLKSLMVPVFFFLSFSGKAQVTYSNSLSLYGWMDQYSMNTENNFVGDESCVPTSSVNALVYLQNLNPPLFGTAFTGGTNYSNWYATDDQLINLYGTTASNGTSYDQFVHALKDYIQLTNGFSQVSFSSMFPADYWSLQYPDPSFNTDGKPSVTFLTNSLSLQSALLVSIEYGNGNGHELLANGITWDTNSGTGTLAFIDPLDPSLSYNGTNVSGTAKETTGTLSLDSNGVIIMDYLQYQGSLTNNTNSYSDVRVKLDGALSLTVVPEPSALAFLMISVLAIPLLRVARNRV